MLWNILLPPFDYLVRVILFVIIFCEPFAVILLGFRGIRGREPRIFWSFINPRNFHFYCIFGPLFWQLELYQGQKNRFFFEKFRKNFGLFRKIHKTPKISVKIGSKTSKWSKFGLILPFLPKNGHFALKSTVFLKISAPSAPKFGALSAPSAPITWSWGPLWAEPPISLKICL